MIKYRLDGHPKEIKEHMKALKKIVTVVSESPLHKNRGSKYCREYLEVELTKEINRTNLSEQNEED